jgi:hypothetical protein
MERTSPLGQKGAGVSHGGVGRGNAPETNVDDLLAARCDDQVMTGRCFRSTPFRVHRFATTAHDVGVNAILDVGAAVRNLPQPLGVRIVVGEEQLRVTRSFAQKLPELGVRGDDRGRTGLAEARAGRARIIGRPGVTKPERGQDVDLGGLVAPVEHSHPHHDIVNRGLGILDGDIEVAIVVEHACVQKFVFELVATAAPVGVYQIVVGEGGVRVLIEEALVGVGRGGVEVEVVLLHVLAMIAFAVREAKEALLENGVLAVPHGQGQAQQLLIVGEACDPVLSPPVGARTRLIV